MRSKKGIVSSVVDGESVRERGKVSLGLMVPRSAYLLSLMIDSCCGRILELADPFRGSQ
jgi:hypothetical protein